MTDTKTADDDKKAKAARIAADKAAKQAKAAEDAKKKADAEKEAAAVAEAARDSTPEPPKPNAGDLRETLTHVRGVLRGSGGAMSPSQFDNLMKRIDQALK